MESSQSRDTLKKRGINQSELRARENNNHCQARENVEPVQTAGKHVTSFKRGKTCNQFQQCSSAGKNVIRDNREET